MKATEIDSLRVGSTSSVEMRLGSDLVFNRIPYGGVTGLGESAKLTAPAIGAVAIDPDGNAYEVGYTNASLPGQTYSGANYDAYLAKFDPSGNVAWARQVTTGSVTDNWNGVAVGPAGEIYVGGNTGTNQAFPGQTSSGNRDATLARYDASGNLIWVRHIPGTATNDATQDVAVDASGNVYAFGLTGGTMQGSPQAFSGTYENTWVTKYDSSGNQQWIRQEPTPGASSSPGNKMAVSPSGNVYICGTGLNLSGAANVGTGYNLFTVKYDTSGNRIWVKQFGLAGSNGFGSRVFANIDSNENVYLAGMTLYDFTTGARLINYDPCVIKYDSSGNQQWARQYGAVDSSEYIAGSCVDRDDNLLICGMMDGVNPWPGTTWQSTGQYPDGDAFIVKFDGAGNQLQAQLFGQPGGRSARLYGVVADESNNYYVATVSQNGSLYGQYGAFPGYTQIGSVDAGVAKLDPSFNLL